MSVTKRLALLFRVKANKALDRAEDPREVLDYSYQRQTEMLAQVRRGLADVATSRKRLELQARQLQQSAERLQGQATQAVQQGQVDLAREALTRRAAVVAQIKSWRPSTTRSRPKRTSSPWPSNGCSPRWKPSAPARKPSRPLTPLPRRKPRSARPSRVSPRRWATWAWRCNARRTRPPKCSHGLPRSMS